MGSLKGARGSLKGARGSVKGARGSSKSWRSLLSRRQVTLLAPFCDDVSGESVVLGRRQQKVTWRLDKSDRQRPLKSLGRPLKSLGRPLKSLGRPLKSLGCGFH